MCRTKALTGVVVGLQSGGADQEDKRSREATRGGTSRLGTVVSDSRRTPSWWVATWLRGPAHY